jgi:sugar phosphate isomerase/epimerase
MENIRIGTLLYGQDAERVIPQLIPYGFESYCLAFWLTTGNVDLIELAKKVKDILAGKDIIISALTLLGNPLSTQGKYADSRASWERLIDCAHLFGTNLVSGWAGRVAGRPIDESMPVYQKVFGELGKRAMDKGVKIAFENCHMGGNWQSGDWNIAHNPTAWEMIFNAVPLDNIGLEWEPCHQLLSLTDPIPQLRKWLNKIFHVHGKDATVAWDIIREYGIHGPKEFAWHRFAGFGDSNWTDIISILREGGYKGTIDIEGFHDNVYNGQLEMTGQVHSLQYLKHCRGGDFIDHPRDDFEPTL